MARPAAFVCVLLLARDRSAGESQRHPIAQARHIYCCCSPPLERVQQYACCTEPC